MTMQHRIPRRLVGLDPAEVDRSLADRRERVEAAESELDQLARRVAELTLDLGPRDGSDAELSGAVELSRRVAAELVEAARADRDRIVAEARRQAEQTAIEHGEGLSELELEVESLRELLADRRARFEGGLREALGHLHDASAEDGSIAASLEAAVRSFVERHGAPARGA